ncbi:MAG: ATP-binding protein [Candidatus Margulisiibacteriota bacterium]|nr:ATP-binding protein [Candidatus Margulisiibacteriota bacterium]
MDRALLKEIVLEQREVIKNKDLGIEREKLDLIEGSIKLPHAIVISGIRRVGKSTLLAQIMSKFYKYDAYYLNFEDERLMDFKVSDFNTLYEIFVELFGEKQVFFFDEIQNVKEWEAFVRRMYDRKFKFFITGSNASLLSKELGTKLTGRFVPVELFPFSFREYMRFKKYSLPDKALMLTKERGKIKRFFNGYLKEGGMPEYLKYKDLDILRRIYDDILYRDVVARYRIKEIKNLREMSLYFLSNLSALFSYNKLKQYLNLGSINTVKSFAEYLQNTYILFVINIFSFSLKQQFIAPKKIYCVDNALANAIAFKFSENRGKFLENVVFVELKRRGSEIYYHKTAKGLEVDFLVKKGRKVEKLIQVTLGMGKTGVKERELNALLSALEELDVKEGMILTEEEEKEIKLGGKKITVKPVYKWLLE